MPTLANPSPANLKKNNMLVDHFQTKDITLKRGGSGCGYTIYIFTV